jgi:4-hydroxybenzoate polyprenyltransferase
LPASFSPVPRRETLPVLIGERKTLIILQGISGFLFVLLFAAPPAGWSTSLSFFLLTCVFYIWICFKLYDRRSGFSGVVLEGLLESGYMIAGVSSFFWLVAVRGPAA